MPRLLLFSCFSVFCFSPSLCYPSQCSATSGPVWQPSWAHLVEPNLLFIFSTGGRTLKVKETWPTHWLISREESQLELLLSFQLPASLLFLPLSLLLLHLSWDHMICRPFSPSTNSWSLAKNRPPYRPYDCGIDLLFRAPLLTTDANNAFDSPNVNPARHLSL